MEKITSREILHQIREEAAKKISDSRCRILICAGTGCLAGGSGEIYRRMSELAEENPDIDVEFGPEIAHGSGPLEVKKSGCHGFCEMGPLMRIEPAGILYTKVNQHVRSNLYKLSAGFQVHSPVNLYQCLRTCIRYQLT